MTDPDTRPSSSEQPAAKKKRGAERQITKDDHRADSSDDPEDPVHVVTDPREIRAAPQVLAKRKMVKVARHADGSLDFSKKKQVNPFAKIQLKAETTTTKKESTTAPAPSIFGSSAGFSGFGTASSGGGFGSGGFGGFGSAAATNSGSGSTPALSFGSAKGFAAAAAPPKDGFVFGKKQSETSTDSQDDTKKDDDKKEETPSTFTFASLPPVPQPSKEGDTTTSAEGNADTTVKGPQQTAILPTDYQLESGEENEVVLLECRCKTHRWGPKKSSDSDETTPTPAAAAVPHSETSFGNNNKNQKDDSKKSEMKKEEKTENANTTNGDEPSKSAATSTDDNDLKKKEDDAAPKPTESIWHEVGVGPLRILKKKDTGDESLVRLVQRRQVNPSAAPTKVLLNVRVFSESTVQQPGEKHVQFTTPPDTMYLFKSGLASTATELAQCLQQQVDQAPSCFQSKTTAATTTTHGDNQDGETPECDKNDKKEESKDEKEAE